jgi:glutaredoxin-related protein
MWPMIHVISGIFEVLNYFLLILFDHRHCEDVGKGGIRYGVLGTFVKLQKAAVGLNRAKTKYMIVERKNSLKENKIGHLKIKNYKFERVENFKYLGVILNEDNNKQIDLQERIKTYQRNYNQD